jgi:hypothetical protein
MEKLLYMHICCQKRQKTSQMHSFYYYYYIQWFLLQGERNRERETKIDRLRDCLSILEKIRLTLHAHCERLFYI